MPAHTRQTSASARAEVWFNQLASARRVNLSTTGELIGQSENSAYEAVRLGPDSFLVRDGACLVGAQGDAQTTADLRAGSLVGGVRQATPGGRQAVINGQMVYPFSFTEADHPAADPPGRWRTGDAGAANCGSPRPSTLPCATTLTWTWRM
ncbi:MAG: hypothetical protein IPK19_15655 [Chloroflexi bacterium]|nr:hypothetical protein [Chloroflexota bacterium]